MTSDCQLKEEKVEKVWGEGSGVRQEEKWVKPMSRWGGHHPKQEVVPKFVCTLKSPSEPQKVLMPGLHI